MLGTWIIFDNDRFDLDGAVKLKLQEALVWMILKATTKEREFYRM
jgi:hypothetical protein